MPKLHLFYTMAILLSTGAAQAAGVPQATPGSGTTTAPPNVATTQNAPYVAMPAKPAVPSPAPANPWDMSTWKFHAGETPATPPSPKTSGAR